MTSTLLGLTNQLKEQDVDNIDDIELRSQLDTLQVDTKEARRRLRIVKSVVAAVVAGSGIDWARDDELRDLVLDAEE